MATKIADSDSDSSLKNLIPHTRGVDQDGTAFGLQQGWDVDLSCRIKKNGVTQGDADDSSYEDADADSAELHGGHCGVWIVGVFPIEKLNLLFFLFCFVRLHELTFFCDERVLSVVVTFRKNLWNWLPHLQELKISELSLMTRPWSSSIFFNIVVLSTMQILHCRVRADFIQRILSPLQTIDGSMIVFIFALTPL